MWIAFLKDGSFVHEGQNKPSSNERYEWKDVKGLVQRLGLRIGNVDKWLPPGSESLSQGKTGSVGIGGGRAFIERRWISGIKDGKTIQYVFNGRTKKMTVEVTGSSSADGGGL